MLVARQYAMGTARIFPFFERGVGRIPGVVKDWAWIARGRNKLRIRVFH